MSKITITRTERVMISGQADLIDTTVFQGESDAEKFLREHVPALNDAHFMEMWAEPETNFENREMINRGVSAYLGTVIYEITVQPSTETEQQKYMDVFEREFTAQQLIDDARANLNELTDGENGEQMHRRAVVGKHTFAKMHAPSGDAPYWGFPVVIRVEGQYTDRAGYKLATRAMAEKLLAEVQSLLDSNPVGILK